MDKVFCVNKVLMDMIIIIVWGLSLFITWAVSEFGDGRVLEECLQLVDLEAVHSCPLQVHLLDLPKY